MKKVFWFLVAGGTASAVNLLSLYVLVSVLGVWYVTAALLAFFVAFAVSFTMQKTFTFKSVGWSWKQLIGYLLVQSTNLAVNLSLLYLLVQYAHVWYLLAQVFITAGIAIYSFFIFNFVIFPAPASNASWFDFWNTEQSIYVSEKSKQAYYQKLGHDMVNLLAKSNVKHFLDYGCGYALATPALLAAGIRVYLYDPVPLMQEYARKYFSSDKNVVILSNIRLPQGTLDAIMLYSVMQYIPPADISALFAQFKTILRPGGKLYLGDLVPPNDSMIKDLQNVLGFALKNGFFLRTCWSLVKTFFSPYRSIRKKHGFGASVDEIRSHLATAGFAVEYRPNIGVNTNRVLIEATSY